MKTKIEALIEFDLLEKIKKHEEKTGISRAKLIRRALEFYLLNFYEQFNNR